jgi:hypothetical protein
VLLRRENTPVLRAKAGNGKQGMTYETMAAGIRALFVFLGIVCRKLTHAMRVGGAQWLESYG